MGNYIATLGIPSLTSEMSQEMEKPITMEELQQVVKKGKGGKAPGPDGYTIQYYRTFMPELGSFMVKLFNGLGDSGILHNESLKAVIAVIPKEGKDPSQCGNYRPISLLN